MGSLLEVKDLGFRKSRKDKFLFENISFSLKAGEKAAVYGTSGSGKTVFTEIICGLVKPSRGSVKREGIPAVVAQKFILYEDLTVTENLDFISTINGYEAKIHEEIIAKTGLTGCENTRAEKLPIGLKKMLQYACAISREFSVLVIDEPTAGLDDKLSFLAWKLIGDVVKSGKAVLFFTPRNSDAAHCEKVYYLPEANFVQKQSHIGVEKAKKVEVGG